MTLDPALSHRLAFLLRVVGRGDDQLVLTDGRLVAAPYDVARAERLFVDHDLAERVEAFLGRFARRGWQVAEGFFIESA